VTTKRPLQKILQGILHTESETQHNHERTGSTKLQEKKQQQSIESKVNLGTHNQTFEQQRKLNDRNHHIPSSTNT
jgi:hypothetical protein